LGTVIVFASFSPPIVKFCPYFVRFGPSDVYCAGFFATARHCLTPLSFESIDHKLRRAVNCCEMAWPTITGTFLESLARFAIGLCPVFILAMLLGSIPRTLVRTTAPTGIIITATVSVLVCCSIEMIRSLTLPSFLLQERFGGHMLAQVEPSRILVALSTHHIYTQICFYVYSTTSSSKSWQEVCNSFAKCHQHQRWIGHLPS
jgi:hypothetical protein